MEEDSSSFVSQYSVFNQETFLKYLKELLRKFGKIIYFPKGSSEFNAVEECWRQGKYDLLVSKYYPKFEDFRHVIADYYNRTRRFKLNIVNYLSRSVS